MTHGVTAFLRRCPTAVVTKKSAIQLCAGLTMWFGSDALA